MGPSSATNSTESSLYMFRDVHAPGNFLIARVAALTMGLGSVTMYCVFTVIVVKAFRKKTRGKNSRRLILGLLLANIITSIMTEIIWTIGLNLLSGIEINLCNYWARLGGLLYVMCNFFSYMILLMRAEAVGVVKGSGKIEKTLFKITLIAVKVGTASVPLLALLCMVLFEGKTYFIEEYCIEAVTAWLSWLFLFLDTSLSMGYLLLFLLPVLIHMRKMRSVTPALGPSELASKKSSGSDSIKATAIRNLKISSTAITSTFIFMLFVSLVSSFGSSEDEYMIPYAHLNVFQYYGGATDVFVNVICNMLMTKNLWAAKTSTKSKHTKGGVTSVDQVSNSVTSTEVTSFK